MNKAKISAQWSLSLDCHCPVCRKFFDILDYDFFWVDNEGLEPIEHGTDRANNLPVTCPKCHHEFEVACEY